MLVVNKMIKLIIIDQTTKLLMSFLVQIRFSNFLAFEFWGNTSYKLKNIFYPVLLLILLGFIIKRFYQRQNVVKGLVIIMAGAISNLLDFLLRGYVVDWIQISDFPIFNIADIYIVVGIMWTLLAFFVSEEKHKEEVKIKSENNLHDVN